MTKKYLNIFFQVPILCLNVYLDYSHVLNMIYNQIK